MDRRNLAFLFYGFTAAWTIVFVYLLTLVLRVSRIRSALMRFEAALDRLESPSSARLDR